jgi:hypothetical protein
VQTFAATQLPLVKVARAAGRRTRGAAPLHGVKVQRSKRPAARYDQREERYHPATFKPCYLAVRRTDLTTLNGVKRAIGDAVMARELKMPANDCVPATRRFLLGLWPMTEGRRAYRTNQM